MRYGTEVTVLPSGIRLASRRIESIGIFGDSSCWGLWVPDWSAATETSYAAEPDHLIVAPFPHSAWPFLFRLELYLADDVGALTSVVRLLHERRLNVHMIEGVPSRHHHATVNLIFEALDFRNDKELMDPVKEITSDDELLQHLQNVLVPTCMKVVSDVEQALNADASSESVDGATFGHQTKAVRCTWLERLAYSWVYGTRHGSPLRFYYDESSSQLKPKPDSEDVYRCRLENRSKISKTIACFDSSERFLRFAFSQKDATYSTRAATLYYDVYFEAFDDTSAGLLRHLCDSLRRRDFSFRGIRKTLKTLSREKETGVLHILVSRGAKKAGIDASDDEDEFHAALNEVIAKMSPRRTEFGLGELGTFGTDQLFVSSRMEWMTDTKAGVFEALPDRASKHGLECRYAVRQLMSSDEKREPSHRMVTENALQQICSSKAFLQVIPDLGADQNMGGWLLFELGAAASLGLERAICVDTQRMSIGEWRSILGVFGDEHLFEFSSGDDNDKILGNLEDAIRDIGERIA